MTVSDHQHFIGGFLVGLTDNFLDLLEIPGAGNLALIAVVADQNAGIGGFIDGIFDPLDLLRRGIIPVAGPLEIVTQIVMDILAIYIAVVGV